jgi:ABC-type multidrug transport system ATPase subunit
LVHVGIFGDRVIEVRNIVEGFGDVAAVNDLSFGASPGWVMAFLGPNGSGKSTTMRCMRNLDRASASTATFDGSEYRSIENPLFEVRSLLDAGCVRRGRTGRNRLRWMAMSNGIDTARADESLALVGLTDAANLRIKGYSLGDQRVRWTHALAFCLVSLEFALLFGAVAILYGISLSVAALLVEDVPFHKYRGW